MGVILRKSVSGEIQAGLWEISESEEELLEKINLQPEEWNLYSTFRTEWRKKQWLAYRNLIREFLYPEPFTIEYDVSGKPYLTGSHYHISVTHTGNMAGAIISPVSRVGIDIEKVHERILKVRDKFMTPDELAEIPEDRTLFYLTLAWCAKESIYKLVGSGKLDFRKQIRVFLPGEDGLSWFRAEVTTHEGTEEHQLCYEKYDDLLMVCAMENK